ncbi:MAG: hypothetical protein KDC05_10100 [Bacteroidales bacterium]|nr:hypothetical protein [Bacteroidales bacterium]
MKNQLLTYISFLFLLISCVNIQPEGESWLQNANFDPETRILKLPPDYNLDTVLQQIIFLSEIRKEGYGVLLNADATVQQKKIDQIIYKFRKLDINAVHQFNLPSQDSIPNHVKVAMEGAKFIWILDQDDIVLSEKESLSLRNLNYAINDGKGILILSAK